MLKYPFTPELLDALPEELSALYRELEIKLLEEICSRLKISDQLNEVTVQDIRALRSHGIDLKEIKKAIAKYTGIGEKKLEKLFGDVVARNQKYYKEVIDFAHVTAPETVVSAETVEAIRKQTRDTFRNLTQSMGFLVDKGRTMLPPAKAYQWALDNAEMQIQSGAISYNQAIANSTRQLADSGLCIAYDNAGNPINNMAAYESGHRDHLDVAVRRAVMTGVNQLNQKYRDQLMDDLETDLVEVTAHRGARNIDGPNGWENHEKWQGKVYRWSGKSLTLQGNYPDFVKTCGYGSVTGIGGANCRHSFWAYVEGMPRAHTDADLEEMKAENHKFKFEGKEYDGYTSTQKQRDIERTIRFLKRRRAAFQAARLKGEADAVYTRILRLNDKYKAFSEAAGLPEQWERSRVLDAT